MVWHVGVYREWVAVYEEISENTFTFQIPRLFKFPPNYKDEADSLFKCIKTKIGGELGCACIYGRWSNNNVHRNEIIQAGKEHGFLKVEFIDFSTLEYISFILQAEYEPKEGEVIWLLQDNHFEDVSVLIWEKISGKSKIIYNSSVRSRLDERNLLQIKTDSGINKNPNIIIYDARRDLKIFEDESCVEDIFPSCTMFKNLNRNPFSKPWPDTNLAEAALLKARIMANDKTKLQFDVAMHLDCALSVTTKRKFVFHFEPFITLPIERTVNMRVKDDEKDLFVNDDDTILNPISIPKYNHMTIKFHIDKNGMYSAQFYPVYYLILYNQWVIIYYGSKELAKFPAAIDYGVMPIKIGVTHESPTVIKDYFEYKDEKSSEKTKTIHKIDKIKKYFVLYLDDGENLIERKKFFADLLHEARKYFVDKAENCEQTEFVYLLIPLFFSNNEKEDYLKAAAIVGYKNLEAVDEIHALAIGYEVDSNIKNGKYYILVYGSGTKICVSLFKSQTWPKNEIFRKVINTNSYLLQNRSWFDNIIKEANNQITQNDNIHEICDTIISVIDECYGTLTIKEGKNISIETILIANDYIIYDTIKKNYPSLTNIKFFEDPKKLIATR